MRTSSKYRGSTHRPSVRKATSCFAVLMVMLLASSIACAEMPSVRQDTQGVANDISRKTPSAAQRSTVLDRVVAVAGDQAILASDVDEELRFAAFQPEVEPVADNTPQLALDRVIDRTLIDQQRALQPGIAEISQKQVEQSVRDLRMLIPACVKYDCKTEAGWQAFLAAHGFTQSEVEDRIRERLAILKFIDLRFGVAARVPTADAQKYYDQVLKPELERDKAEVPAFNAVAPRIREILRQQQVNTMVDQWLKSLRSEQHVRILDAAYGNGENGQ